MNHTVDSLMSHGWFILHVTVKREIDECLGLSNNLRSWENTTVFKYLKELSNWEELDSKVKYNNIDGVKSYLPTSGMHKLLVYQDLIWD